MKNVPTQTDDVTELSAVFFNDIPEEMENTITSSGQTLVADPPAPPDNTQLGKALSIYSGAGAAFRDTGSANNYVLSGFGSRIAPDSYPDAFTLVFTPANTNTTASTVNLNTIGAKDVRNLDGSPIVAGQLFAGFEYALRFSTANDYFTLLGPTKGSPVELTILALGENYLPNDFGTNPDLGSSGTFNLPAPYTYQSFSRIRIYFSARRWTPISGNNCTTQYIDIDVTSYFNDLLPASGTTFEQTKEIQVPYFSSLSGPEPNGGALNTVDAFIVTLDSGVPDGTTNVISLRSTQIVTTPGVRSETDFTVRKIIGYFK